MSGRHSQPTATSFNCNRHLHIWQNDRGLLRATVVTRGGTDTEEESAQKVNSGEGNSPVAPARDLNSQLFDHKSGTLIILINPLTAKVVGAPQMISQPASSIFSLLSTALWDLANSRPVHSLMLSSHLFFCLPCLLPPFTVPCKMDLGQTGALTYKLSRLLLAALCSSCC